MSFTTKHYKCLQYPNYRVKHLVFKNGLLTVTNLNDQRWVEKCGLYGALIFPV